MISPQTMFETLFEQHCDDVRRYVARRHRGHDVEDLVAEVFTTAWQKIAEIPQNFELPWLYRTAWFTLANAHRKAMDFPTDIDISGVQEDIADEVIANEQLLYCWNALEPKDREVLRLSAWEGLSGREMAQVLGIGEGGASAALSRARQHLRQAWDSYV